MAVPTTRSQTSAPARRASLIDRFSVVVVAIAAVIWVSDAYFRNPLTSHLTASQIVFAEDALVTIFLLPLLVGGWRELGRLTSRQWLALIVIGVGPQALATWLLQTPWAFHGAVSGWMLFAASVARQQSWYSPARSTSQP